MNLETFMALYDNWNGITKVNDDNLNTIVKGRTTDIMDRRAPLHPSSSVKSYAKLLEMEVVAFGFYDNELCVRVV